MEVKYKDHWQKKAKQFVEAEKDLIGVDYGQEVEKLVFY
jgi:hypothetical protein